MFIEPRPTISSSLPPFENGFQTWKNAVGYYTDQFNAGNIHIIKSTSGTNLNPIVVPLTAPTPQKPKKRIPTKNCTAISKKGAKVIAQPVASSSRQVASSGVASGLSKTKVVKGKKRARSRTDESDSEGYPPLYDDDDIVLPSKDSEVVIDVSDFGTPSPPSKRRTS